MNQTFPPACPPAELAAREAENERFRQQQYQDARYFTPDLITYLHKIYGRGRRYNILLRELFYNFRCWSQLTLALHVDTNWWTFEELLKDATTGCKRGTKIPINLHRRTHHWQDVEYDYLMSWSDLQPPQGL